MATTLSSEDTSHEPTDRETDEARIDRIVAKFDAEDAKADAPTDDETDETDETDDDDSTDDTSDDDEEHTDEDSAETSDDSTDDDDDEADDADDADDQSTESDDDADDAEATEETDDDEVDEEDEEDEDDLGITQETRDALSRRGVDPNFLKDVPEEHRPAVAKIVEKKIASVDRAFTQEMQERSQYRAERKQFLADKAFREEKKNHHLLIVELLRQGGDALMQRVNDQLDALNPEAEGNNKTKVETYEAALDAEMNDKRRKAADTIDEAVKDYSRRLDRAGEIETIARDAAKRHKVPMGLTIQKLLAAEINKKPEGQEDLSDDEVEAVVAAYAGEHNRSVRAHRREESKKSVQDRAKNRNRPKSGVRAPKVAQSAGAAKKKKSTGTNEEQGMALARRLWPGAKDD